MFRDSKKFNLKTWLKIMAAKNTQDNSKSKSMNSAVSGDAAGLGRLLGVMAHEIKNPLSTIKINLRLIDEELSAAPKAGETSQNSRSDDTGQRLSRARRKLDIIDKEAARLEQILDGFLRYADLTQPHPVPVDVNSLLGDMVDFFLPQALAHSIQFRQSFCKEPLICPVDAAMFKQAVLNLFINAQQALVAGGELMVRTSREGNFAKIQICDTGKGISAERLGRIFEPYQSTRPDGSGLGLATVKKIINAHNGTVSVVSEPNKGTSFTITLPLADATTQEKSG